MEEEDDNIDYESKEDTTSMLNDVNKEDKEDVNDTFESDVPLKINDLAAQLLSEGNKCFNLSKEEERMIAGSSVNRKKYGKSKEGVETRFFETIEHYGSAELKKLLTMGTPGPGMLPERVFYSMLRGD
jgi:hypothetical protein